KTDKKLETANNQDLNPVIAREKQNQALKNTLRTQADEATVIAKQVTTQKEYTTEVAPSTPTDTSAGMLALTTEH
ncbi:type IV pilus biogenesis/stability protein PilW, partial [Pseudoalteromonas issachenkonii]